MSKIDHEKIAADYLEAFRAANGGVERMFVSYRNGYFYIGGGWSKRACRAKQVLEMTQRLRDRAEGK